LVSFGTAFIGVFTGFEVADLAGQAVIGTDVLGAGDEFFLAGTFDADIVRMFRIEFSAGDGVELVACFVAEDEEAFCIALGNAFRSLALAIDADEIRVFLGSAADAFLCEGAVFVAKENEAVFGAGRLAFGCRFALAAIAYEAFIARLGVCPRAILIAHDLETFIIAVWEALISRLGTFIIDALEALADCRAVNRIFCRAVFIAADEETV
jgi:hypothetical protein